MKWHRSEQCSGHLAFKHAYVWAILTTFEAAMGIITQPDSDSELSGCLSFKGSGALSRVFFHTN